ncbi:HAMP domain-containing histidine kinase [Mycolicibacterium sp. 3033]|nr:HAMP domain-containing histidine kinase [Mycolicibacterium aurantiacum]
MQPHPDVAWPGQHHQPPAGSSVSLRWRVMLLAMSMVLMAVVLMGVAVYAVMAQTLYQDIDNQLTSRADMVQDSGSLVVDPGKIIEGTAYSDIKAMFVIPGRAIYAANPDGELPALGDVEKDVIAGRQITSLRTVSHNRLLARHFPDGTTLLMWKSLAPTGKALKNLGTVLLSVGGIGVAIAAIAGGMVATAGLRPVARLTQAAERVARTDDLRPIPVVGHDELARLTEAFNMMLRALAESRDRQARLVTDAGHELRTPLTSLRTNVELLMASMQPGAPRIPEDEMADLQADVMGQIEELSTLVGDLVDLTREDAGRVVHEIVDITDVIDRSLERVRRRRNDIEFDVAVAPWQVYGDAAGLGRAVLNLLDNAAKWSPPGGHVGVRLRQVDANYAALVVSDNGPGIPAKERDLVFERFYRSTAARAMPGSGLGLAIVKQVVAKHGGTLLVTDTDDGGDPPGTSMHMVLPGRAPISAEATETRAASSPR